MEQQQKQGSCSCTKSREKRCCWWSSDSWVWEPGSNAAARTGRGQEIQSTGQYWQRKRDPREETKTENKSARDGEHPIKADQELVNEIRSWKNGSWARARKLAATKRDQEQIQHRHVKQESDAAQARAGKPSARRSDGRWNLGRRERRRQMKKSSRRSPRRVNQSWAISHPAKSVAGNETCVEKRQQQSTQRPTWTWPTRNELAAAKRKSGQQPIKTENNKHEKKSSYLAPTLNKM
jgi:hypothetical protein